MAVSPLLINSCRYIQYVSWPTSATASGMFKQLQPYTVLYVRWAALYQQQLLQHSNSCGYVGMRVGQNQQQLLLRSESNSWRYIYKDELADISNSFCYVQTAAGIQIWAGQHQQQLLLYTDSCSYTNTNWSISATASAMFRELQVYIYTWAGQHQQQLLQCWDSCRLIYILYRYCKLYQYVYVMHDDQHRHWTWSTIGAGCNRYK